MLEIHSNSDKYIEYQIQSTKEYLIPFVSEHINLDSNSSILEIGCGEGGNLIPFAEMGCNVVGYDLSVGKINKGNDLFSERGFTNYKLIIQDIYDVNDPEKFDFIIMKDVIEHIHNQDKFFGELAKFLKPKGKIYFGFPPWRMPYGGHQQVIKSKFLSKLPYYHILPTKIYDGILKLFGQKETKGLLEIKETGISINRFFKLVNQHNYKVFKKEYYLINPNY